MNNQSNIGPIVSKALVETSCNLDLFGKDLFHEATYVKITNWYSRFGHSQVTANGSIYVFGGRMGTDIGEKLMNDLWRFDPKTSKWTELTQTAQGQPPSPRSFQVCPDKHTNNKEWFWTYKDRRQNINPPHKGYKTPPSLVDYSWLHM